MLSSLNVSYVLRQSPLPAGLSPSISVNVTLFIESTTILFHALVQELIKKVALTQLKPFLINTQKPSTNPLRPVKTNKHSFPPFYRGCWPRSQPELITEYSHYVLQIRAFTSNDFFTQMILLRSSFRPLSTIFPTCCLIKSVGFYFSPIVDSLPLRLS